MIPWRIGRKSGEEKELERKVKLREAKGKIRSYISRCRKILEEYEKNAVEAKKLGNERLYRRFYSKSSMLKDHIKKAKTVLLILNDIELSREQIGLSRDFIEVVDEMMKSITESEIDAEMMMDNVERVENAITESERIDEILGEFAEILSEKIITAEDLNTDDIREIIDMMDKIPDNNRKKSSKEKE